MRPLEEVFLESDFDSRALARQRRDERLVELQEQGYECRAENLAAVHTGMRIFTVIAIPPDAAESLPRTEKRKTIAAPVGEEERSTLQNSKGSRSQATPKVRVKDRGVPRKGDRN